MYPLRLRVLMGVILLGLCIGTAKADARTHSVAYLVNHAHGNPFHCDRPNGHYTRNTYRCITRLVFHHRRLELEANAIIGCESGWDRWQVTPPFNASGLAQFLPGTWRNLPRRISRHSVFSPVWNIRGMRYLRLADGSWSEWSCQP